MTKLRKKSDDQGDSQQQSVSSTAMADSQPPPAVEPPAYTPPEPTRPHRSIADLRAQIIANGSVIRPRNDVNKSSDDHIELIVAKTPAPRNASRGNPRLHWNEKEAMSAFNRGSDPMRPSYTATARAGSSGPAMAASGQGQKHYAVLMKRSGGNRTIYVIVQGEPRDTVEDALEWMLERTEQMCHDLIIRNGKPDPGDGCMVM